MNRDPILDIRDLTVSYGRRTVLGPLSCAVAPGGVVGVFGGNGSGKSTLLRALVGDTAAEGGRVFLDGQDVAGLAVDERVRAGLSYLPQKTNVFPGLTGMENIRAAFAEEKVALGLLGEIAAPLVSKLGTQADLLSGGDRQSLALAMVLSRPAKVFLLDEPFAGLTEERKERSFRAILRRLSQLDAAAIIVDHGDLVLSVCEKRISL